MLRWLLCLAGCLCVVACAAAPRPVLAPKLSAPAVDVAVAERLVDQGCYQCLVDAYALYEAALRGPDPAPDVQQQAFTVALLLALRERELGLAMTGWLDTARRLAQPSTSIYVDIATSIPWVTVGTATDFDRALLPSAATRQAWLVYLERPGPRSLLDRYVWLALTCSRQDATGLEAVTVDRPILQYRLGACGAAQRGQLDSVLASDPRFVEAGFFIARYELSRTLPGQQRVTRALPLLLDARRDLPWSPTVTITLAHVWRTRTELARGLGLYDEALATQPTEREALLGRTMTLTYLNRPEEAIAAATRMIDLGTWYLGDAYYWRALNHYQLSRLAMAASDVAEAKQLQSSGELMTLSGMVAYDQQRRADAKDDFTNARRISVGNCTASWYLGLIGIDEMTWTPAQQLFRDATTCYEATIEALRVEMAQPQADLSPEALVQLQRDQARRMTDNQRQRARSALNAALVSLQLNDRDTAAQYARIATDHELTRDRANAALERAGSPPPIR